MLEVIKNRSGGNGCECIEYVHLVPLVSTRSFSSSRVSLTLNLLFQTPLQVPQPLQHAATGKLRRQLSEEFIIFGKAEHALQAQGKRFVTVDDYPAFGRKRASYV